jgi:hypothetical protein
MTLRKIRINYPVDRSQNYVNISLIKRRGANAKTSERD